MTTEGRLVLSRRMQQIPLALIAIGAVATGVGLFAAPTRTWLNLLVDGFYVMALGVSGIFFITTQRLSSAKWSASIRRVPEALMMVMPAACVLMLVLFIGFRSIYPWMSPGALEHEPLPFKPGRELWLTPAFVYARMVVILALWMLFAFRMRKVSLDGDASRQAGLIAHQRLNRYSGVFVLVFALTITSASYDWLISQDPKWFSTMFGVYVFAGVFVQGIAAIGLATVQLRQRGYFGPKGAMIGLEPVHTLGTMVLAFSTFWGYIWVCQYLLIWYGNIPEEVTYYITRSSGWWLPIFLGGFVINWIIPFFALLSRKAKRSARMMTAICILVLCGRWLDLYLMVMPSHWESPHFGPLEIAMAAGTGGLIYLLVVRALSKAPLVPTYEPIVAARRAHGHEGGSS